jgi:hypothetical protein
MSRDEIIRVLKLELFFELGQIELDHCHPSPYIPGVIK